MAATTIPMLPDSSNVSSLENHKKIAAFLEATARHLEPLKYPDPVEEQSANSYQSEVDQVPGKPEVKPTEKPPEIIPGKDPERPKSSNEIAPPEK